MHRCYLPVITGDVVDLPDEEAHHLTRVMRVRTGDAVVVFDGRGHEWDAVVADVARQGVRVRLTDTRIPAPESPVMVTLAVAVLKGDQMATVVRDATAMGAHTIWPFVSSHVAVPTKDWRERTADRWRRVAIASAKQCGRAVVPVIREIGTFADVLAGATDSRLVLCAEPRRMDVARPAPVAAGPPARATVCIGPEGGWSDEEVAEALGRHADVVSLGPRTLRAELAPTVVLSVLWERWGWT